MTEGGTLQNETEPPYYAVIFTSSRSDEGEEEYQAMSAHMMELAATMPGFLGVESARQGIGITISYWRDLESITAWRRDAGHIEAQRLGRMVWYDQYRLRIACVEREYDFAKPRDS